GRKPVEIALGSSFHLYHVLNDAQDVMAKDHRPPMGSLEVAIDELGKIHHDPGQMFLQFAVRYAEVVGDLLLYEKPHQAGRYALQQRGGNSFPAYRSAPAS